MKNGKSVSVTTSIPLELWNLAKEKRFPWNECLILGIKTMNGDRLAPNYEKLQRQRMAMEEELIKKSDENDSLKDAINKLMRAKDERTGKN